MRLIQGVFVSVLVAAGIFAGCTRVQQLQPLFEVNQMNVEEMTGNAAKTAELLEGLAGVVYDSEIRWRRAQVWSQLRSVWADSGGRAAARQPLQAWSTAQNLSATAAKYVQLRSALPASDEANREKLKVADPVLCALVTLEVTDADIWTDSDIAGSAGVSAVGLKDSITDKYPSVRKIVAERAETMAKLKAYREGLERQSTLAKAHAAAFLESAKTNADIAAVFSQLIADDALRGEALGLIKDDKAKATAEDALGLIGGLLAAQSQRAPGP